MVCVHTNVRTRNSLPYLKRAVDTRAPLSQGLFYPFALVLTMKKGYLI